MKLTLLFGIFLLATLASGAPSSSSSSSSEEDDEPVVVTKNFFPDKLALYTSEHDIVKITVPVNALNFGEDDDEVEDNKAVIFFVEADVKDGKKDYKGLYFFDRNSTKLLLANGRDAAAPINEQSQEVYFAAADGIYSYDSVANTANKYGTFDKPSFAIAVTNDSSTIYVITDDKDLYKITNEGKDAKKIDVAGKVEGMSLDTANNLYFYNAGKSPVVLVDESIKHFPNLPETATHVELLRPLFVIEDNAIPAVINDKAYLLYANQTSELTSFQLQVYPTAYAMEGSLVQYYAYNKKIYEYNFIEIIFGELLSELKKFLEGKQDDLQRLASKPRSAFAK